MVAGMTRSLFLALITFALCGCGPKATNGPAPLRVGMELSTPPFEMADANGKPDGVSVRLAEALAQKLGRPLQIEVLAFKGLETALKTGKIDIILSSMTDTPKRRESIDFSDAYCKIGLALLLPADSTIQDPAELNAPGKKIVARLGTTAVDLVKTKLPQAEVVQLDQNAACLLEVTQKKADAFIYDQLSILKMQAAQPTATRALLKPLQTESWAIALTKENGALKEQINGFLKEFRASGGFEKLATEYLATEKAALAAQGVPFIFE
jgi:polar amino acid transport system substrate-binding protein